jgi:hypothetical protein
MANVIKVNGHLVLRSDWDMSDVHTQAECMNVTLTDEQAEQVLEVVAYGFDANIGINWEVIGNAIANVMADAQALAHEAEQNSF